MKNITALIDTNIPLDTFGKREPFKGNADKVFIACKNGRCNGFIAAHSLTNIFYILRKDFSVEKRKELLLGLCEILDVVGIDHTKLIKALQNDTFNDIEDCLQVECAEAINADYIITRDPAGFVHSAIPVISPTEFLKLI
jgi:predicted nucleic acid-binding protein